MGPITIVHNETSLQPSGWHALLLLEQWRELKLNSRLKVNTQFLAKNPGIIGQNVPGTEKIYFQIFSSPQYENM